MPERQTSPAEVTPDADGDGVADEADATSAAAADGVASRDTTVVETPPGTPPPARERPAAERHPAAPPAPPGTVSALPPGPPAPRGAVRAGGAASAGAVTRPVGTSGSSPRPSAPQEPEPPARAGPPASTPTTPGRGETTAQLAPLRPPQPTGNRTENPTETIRPDKPTETIRPEKPTERIAAERTPSAVPAPVPPPGAPAAEEVPLFGPPPAPAPRPASDDDAPTQVIRAARPGPPEPRPRRRRRALLLVAGVVALLGALYGADLALSAGTVPRDVTVAGTDIGGLSPADAEQRLRAEVGPRTTRPIDVAVGDITSRIDPRAAGLAVDWAATVDRADEQPLNPVTRVRAFFAQRDLPVVTVTDAAAVDAALQQLAPVVNRPAAEGTVRFEGARPVPVPPVDGQNLDLAAAQQVLEREWTSGSTVRLPTTVLRPTTTADDVDRALREFATPAVSGPVVVTGEDVTGTITPEVIAGALTFRPEPGRGLAPELNKGAIEEALDPQLAESEQPGRDASLRFPGPVVTPSQDGRGVDYEATLKDLESVLTRSGDERRLTAVYAAQPAELTTDELNGLGIQGVIGEFTTGGFAADSGRNIKRAAAVINGTIVEPGETFSLNAATEPRTAANGYVEAGVITDGNPSRGVGGGVSQVATTVYNAAYFAGMTDVTHRPHSFYISRYPPGREATVVAGALDMAFRNDLPTGVLIETAWTPTSLTVKLYGTKRYDVTSSTGPRTNPTEPTEVEIPEGQPCVPSPGAPGFTVSDTRTLRDVTTGEVRTERRTTKYNPSPIVKCGGG